jgi:hypothetical protein
MYLGKKVIERNYICDEIVDINLDKIVVTYFESSYNFVHFQKHRISGYRHTDFVFSLKRDVSVSGKRIYQTA